MDNKVCQVMNKKTLRDSNIELFRIITMLLIVAHHYVVNSGLTAADGPIYADPLSLSSLFLLLFGAWGKIGINCFVLITGYFMCKSNITAKKFVKLLFEVMFYRVVIGAIFWITGYEPFSLAAFAKVILPITSIKQNFTGTYLAFFLCIPFLNVLVRNLTEKQHVKLLLLTGFIYVLFGTIPFFTLSMNYVSWYCVLYFIASYIRLHPKRIFDNKKFWGATTVGLLIVDAISVVACVWLGTKIGRNMAYGFVSDSNAFLAVVTGVSAFMYFKNVKLKYNKLINTVSATTFGVLLIHANGDAMRRWLWQDVLNNVEVYDSAWMPIHAAVSVIAIFCVCSVIDLMRIHFVETPFFNVWDKKWDGIAAKYKKIEAALCVKFKIDN